MMFAAFVLVGLAWASVVYAFSNYETGAQPDLYLSELTSHQSPPNPISVRLPPTFGNPPDPDWVQTPPGFQFGTWYIAHSNQAVYHYYRNLQWTLTPLSGYTWPFYSSLHDLTTVQILGDNTSTVYYDYGVDHPIKINGTVAVDAYRFLPTGPLAPYNNTYEILAWGYDTNGVAWEVVYETATIVSSESLDFMVRVADGPAEETVDAIYAAVKALGNERLNALLEGVGKLVQDGGRDGMKYPECNATCKANAYAAA